MLCVDSDYQPDLFLTPLDLVDEILIRIWKMLEFKKICDAFTRKSFKTYTDELCFNLDCYCL